MVDEVLGQCRRCGASFTVELQSAPRKHTADVRLSRGAGVTYWKLVPASHMELRGGRLLHTPRTGDCQSSRDTLPLIDLFAGYASPATQQQQAVLVRQQQEDEQETLLELALERLEAGTSGRLEPAALEPTG